MILSQTKLEGDLVVRTDPGDVDVPVLPGGGVQELQVVVSPLTSGMFSQVDQPAQSPQSWAAAQQLSGGKYHFILQYSFHSPRQKSGLPDCGHK